MIVLMKSPSSSNLGHVGSKSRSVGQIMKKPCLLSRGHIVEPKLMKFYQNDSLMKYWLSLTLGQMGSKSRSVGQIMKKPCKHSRSHIIEPIFMKFYQNDRLDKISFKCKSGSCGVKKYVSRSNHEKTLLTL